MADAALGVVGGVLAYTPFIDPLNLHKVWFWLLVVDFVVLMWCGAMPPEQPFVIISQLGALYWFSFFLVILPLLGVLEKPKAPPATIEDDFRAHYGDPGEAAAQGSAQPAE